MDGTPHQLQVFTIGHSSHPMDRFLDLLQQHGIEAVVDIRRFPGSRQHPHFSRENLALSLADEDMEYRWLEALGGRRHRKKTDPPSPNLGLRDQGFRSYADYMASDEFRQGVAKLLEIAGNRPITGASPTWLESEGCYRNRCVSQRKRPPPQREGEGQGAKLGN